MFHVKHQKDVFTPANCFTWNICMRAALPDQMFHVEQFSIEENYALHETIRAFCGFFGQISLLCGLFVDFSQ